MDVTDNLGSFDDVIRAFRAYALTWEHQADGKRQDALASNEVSFYGALVGAVGGIVKAPPVAIAGAATAAAGGIFSQRYRLEVQASNYALGASAMQCMYDYASPLLNHPEAATNDNRDLALADLMQVRSKLRNLQNSFQLGTPDISKLSDSIKSKSVNLELYFAGLVGKKSNPIEERIAGLKDALNICVAKISG